MQPEVPTGGDGSVDSSPSVGRSTDDNRRLDRRTLIRGTGAVLFAGSLAGCTDEEDDGGSDGGGDDDDDGGGPYAVDSHAVPTE